MTYQTTITTKGQVTIPKAFRDLLQLDKYDKVVVELEKNGKSLKLSPSGDFLAIARKIKTKKKGNPLAGRDAMERSYERH